MADACNPANYPSGMDLLASYVDGRCASDRNDPVRISSIATNAGNVGDCEPGNPLPVTWVQWVRERRAAGVDPTIYCADDSLSSFFNGFRHSDVIAAFTAAGEPQPHYWLTKPGATGIPPGAVAVQVALGVNGDKYDLSLVLDHWPGVDPEAMMLNFDDPVIKEILRVTNATYWMARDGYESDPNGTPPPAAYSVFKDVPATVADIKASLANVTAGTVDVNALATALAAHPLTATLSDAERDAVATHVIQHLSKDTAGG